MEIMQWYSLSSIFHNEFLGIVSSDWWGGAGETGVLSSEDSWWWWWWYWYTSSFCTHRMGCHHELKTGVADSKNSRGLPLLWSDLVCWQSDGEQKFVRCTTDRVMLILTQFDWRCLQWFPLTDNAGGWEHLIHQSLSVEWGGKTVPSLNLTRGVHTMVDRNRAVYFTQ